MRFWRCVAYVDEQTTPAPCSPTAIGSEIISYQLDSAIPPDGWMLLLSSIRNPKSRAVCPGHSAKFGADAVPPWEFEARRMVLYVARTLMIGADRVGVFTPVITNGVRAYGPLMCLDPASLRTAIEDAARLGWARRLPVQQAGLICPATLLANEVLDVVRPQIASIGWSI